MKCGRAYGILLLAGCLLAFGFTASAQEQVWNAALDRYEYVCRRCADWRDRIDRGKAVPRDSLQTLTRELSEVRKNLQYALGEMTPGQRRRFEAVRDWFTSGQWPVQEAGRIVPNGEIVASRLRAVPENRFPGLSPGMTGAEAAGSAAGVVAGSAGGVVSRTASGVASGRVSGSWTTARRISPPRALAGVTVGVYPDLSYGLLAGITLGEWGIFLKGRSNFHWQKTTYECLSDGTIPAGSTPGSPTPVDNPSDTGSTPEGGYFWSGDAKAVNRHHITLNASYALWKPVSIYLGAGYGLRTLCWKDSEGQWARVSDRSFRNFALDAGLLIHPISKGPAKGLTFLLGGTWIPRAYLDAEAGLLWRF